MMPEIKDDHSDVVPPDGTLSLARREDSQFTAISEINQAAQDLGLTVLNAKTLNALRILGANVDNMGAVHVGLGRVIASGEYIAKLLDRATSIAMEDNPDLYDSDGKCIASGKKTTLEAISISNDLIRSQLESAHLLRKMTESKVLRNPSEKRKHRSFAVGENVKVENMQIVYPAGQNTSS